MGVVWLARQIITDSVQCLGVLIFMIKHLKLNVMVKITDICCQQIVFYEITNICVVIKSKGYFGLNTNLTILQHKITFVSTVHRL